MRLDFYSYSAAHDPSHIEGSFDLSGFQFPHLYSGGRSNVLDDTQGPSGFRIPVLFTYKEINFF